MDNARDKHGEFAKAYGGTVTQRTSRIVAASSLASSLAAGSRGNAASLRALLAEGDFKGPPAEPVKPHSDRPGRNQPCDCGSGKKFKKCCGLRQA